MKLTLVQNHPHAQQRKARRNLSNADIEFVLEYGQRMHCAGAMHVFLGRRDLPHERVLHQRHAHLEGTVLVIRVTQRQLILLTVYRNRQALRSIRAKARYNRRKAA